MNTLQADLDAAGINAKILGVNGIGYEAGNASATTGRTSPWLQPTDPATDPWVTWAVNYRDVVILDEQNYPVAVYNLTQYNLGISTNYDTLRAMIVGYATD